MKVWITKYALTTGIQECMAANGVKGGYVYPGAPHFHSWSGFKFGRDAFDSKDAALAAAEEMRAKKLKALHAQIKKLESKRFVVNEAPQ